MALNNGRYHIRCCSYHFILGIQDYFPQHISDIRKFLIDELNSEKENLVEMDKEQEN